MLCAIRRTPLAPLLTLATLLCVVLLSASTLVHSDTDDTLCNPPLVVHADQADRIGGGTASTAPVPDHCAVCHWQSLRIVQAEVLADVPGGEGLGLFGIGVLSFSSATLTRQPARAPPLA